MLMYLLADDKDFPAASFAPSVNAPVMNQLESNNKIYKYFIPTY